jgi:hypothetical protein
MQKLKLRLSQFTKLILLGLCLLLANVSFSQEKYPVLIPYEQDTLIAISPYQFDIVLFAFSYVRSLENTLYLTSNELSNADSVNTHLEEVIALERLKSLEKDSINVNLEQVIKEYKKARRKEKLKKTFTYIGMGLVIGIEAGAITYLLLK